MFVYKLSDYIFLSEISFLIFWFIFAIFLSNILRKDNFNKSIYNYLILLYIFLSIISIIRIYFDFLPFTPDSIYYLDSYLRVDPIGPGSYERFILLINTIFGENIKILIIINIFIYCLTIRELILMVPDYNNQKFNIFFLFTFFFPSIIWFIPNILRESIFIYFIVMVLKYSLIIDNKNHNLTLKVISKIILFSILSFLVRPQILPILFIWLTYILTKRNFISLLISTFIGFVVSQSTYIQSQIMRKLSFHYLESFKTEASSSHESIAFTNLIIPGNLLELLYYAPFLMIRFLFSPFPWELTNIRYAFAYFDSIMVCFFIMILIKNILRKRIFNYNIIFFSFLFIFILSIFEISFTGSVRHRMPFIITLLPCLIFINNEKTNE